MNEQDLRREFERVYTASEGSDLGEVVWLVFRAGALYGEARTREEFTAEIIQRCGGKYAEFEGEPLDIFEHVIAAECANASIDGLAQGDRPATIAEKY
jgi:hypothetical protein